MREGRVAQEGTPESVYGRPADEWVARFLGFVNVFDAEVRPARGRPAVGDGAGGSRDPEDAALPEGPGRATLSPD